MKTECKRHKWRVGAGLGELVDGEVQTTKLCIWCEKCNKKIIARYEPYEEYNKKYVVKESNVRFDKWTNKKISKPKKVNLK